MKINPCLFYPEIIFMQDIFEAEIFIFANSNNFSESKTKILPLIVPIANTLSNYSIVVTSYSIN